MTADGLERNFHAWIVCVRDQRLGLGDLLYVLVGRSSGGQDSSVSRMNESVGSCAPYRDRQLASCFEESIRFLRTHPFTPPKVNDLAARKHAQIIRSLCARLISQQLKHFSPAPER